MRISHEAVYQALYVQGRGALRRELTACLRTGRALRVPRARTQGRGKKFVSPAIVISERPVEVADRAVPGHWEGDLILGLGSSAVGTLVERTPASPCCCTCPVCTDTATNLASSLSWSEGPAWHGWSRRSTPSGSPRAA
jgi:IS30 family transposase